MFDPVKQDKIEKVLKRSKSLKKRGKIRQSIVTIETLGQDMNDKSVKNSWELAKHIIQIWNKYVSQNIAKKESIVHLRKADAILDQYKAKKRSKKAYSKLRVTTNINFSLWHQYQGNYSKSVSFLQNNIPLYEQLNDRRALARLFVNLSAVQTKITKFSQAKKSAQRAIGIMDTLDDKNSNSGIVNNRIVAQYNIGAAEEAMKNYKASAAAYAAAAKLQEELAPNDQQLKNMIQHAIADSSKFPTNRKPKLKKTNTLQLKKTQSTDCLKKEVPEVDQLQHMATQPTLETTQSEAELKSASSHRSFAEKECYFTQKQLDRLQRQFESEQYQVYDTNAYFEQKIGKMLNVSNDCVAMENDPEIKVNDKIKHRRIVSEIKFKRQEKAQLNTHSRQGTTFIYDKLAQIRREIDVDIKKIGIQQISKLRAKQRNKLIDALAAANNMTEPNQRLVFTAPKDDDEWDGELDEADNKVFRQRCATHKFTHMPGKKIGEIQRVDQYEEAKVSIQNLRQEVRADLRQINRKMERSSKSAQRLRAMESTTTWMASLKKSHTSTRTELAQSATKELRLQRNRIRTSTKLRCFEHLVQTIGRKRKRETILPQKHPLSVKDRFFGKDLPSLIG